MSALYETALHRNGRKVTTRLGENGQKAEGEIPHQAARGWKKKGTLEQDVEDIVQHGVADNVLADVTWFVDQVLRLEFEEHATFITTGQIHDGRSGSFHREIVIANQPDSQRFSSTFEKQLPTKEGLLLLLQRLVERLIERFDGR